MTYSGNDAKKISEEIGFIDGVYCIDTSADVHEFFELVYKMHEKPEMNYINDLRRRGILLEYLALAMETSKAKTQRAPVKEAIQACILTANQIDKKRPRIVRIQNTLHVGQIMLSVEVSQTSEIPGGDKLSSA